MNVVEMKGITKRFPGIVANDNIHLTVKEGEIHALLGENGAGKSTLMNILFGLYQPDEGEIRIKGEKVHVTGPSMAGKLGIGMVHQHFMLVDPFTVTENIILGSEPTIQGRIDREKAEREVQEISDRYGLRVDPRARIRDISVGMQQRVEILKTLYRGADILIFDEPTAVLSPQEIDELIEIMGNLVREGKTIIFITHKLKEIMRVCDSVTIIRRGKTIDTLQVKETDENRLASMMVGREVSFDVEKEQREPGETVLSIRDLRVADSRGADAVKGLDLEVRAGEIVGIAGVDGNGQTELLEAITGLRKTKSGRVRLNGKDITNLKPRSVTRSGVGHIPEDRHRRGLVLDFSIGENMVLQTYNLPPFAKGFRLQYSEIQEHAEKLVKEYDVRTPDIHTPARALSGGNQQKAVIAREVERDPDLLIAAQPTRGLDVGAIEFIHRRLIEQRDKGKAVLLMSLELDEVLKLSDRIAVIYEGKIAGWVDPSTAAEEEVGLLMAGGKSGAEVKS
ncbi:nucleoside ABC transporter ATP-binding protein [Melghirimyces profundicolus]|uniref:Nucleoside ABC transporter ATP-binding protein n=1 Tax=Melghirimyces profundicolus TaxID=1242148 RepID=A0A2T6BRD7_9BACL|nr:ABC transporter ATP-binding protein [Melghirimyces profundicolus]PTX58645.1 nucleoside ABC transporter ATP-binding protein [Melghirimyces profundicolus]